jgi:hypothetical protein
VERSGTTRSHGPASNTGLFVKPRSCWHGFPSCHIRSTTQQPELLELVDDGPHHAAMRRHPRQEAEQLPLQATRSFRRWPATRQWPALGRRGLRRQHLYAFNKGPIDQVRLAGHIGELGEQRLDHLCGRSPIRTRLGVRRIAGRTARSS